MNGEFVKELSERLVSKPEVLRVGERILVFQPPASGDPWKLIKKAGPETLSVRTLQGLVDYFKSEVDRLSAEYVVHVVDPTRVNVVGRPASDLLGEREHPASAVLEGLKAFQCDAYHSAESFVISLQSLFVPTAERDELLELVSAIRSSDVTETNDSGYAQEVKVQKGVTMVGNKKAPSVVSLRPYRTFREVDQPASPFALRLKDTGDGRPALLLAEADGGAWRLEAVASIAKWLRERLPGVKPPVVIA